MASRSPTLGREARDSEPGTPEAGADSQPGPGVFCKLCLSEQPSAATSQLQSCNCNFCTAVSKDVPTSFEIFTADNAQIQAFVWTVKDTLAAMDLKPVNLGYWSRTWVLQAIFRLLEEEKVYIPCFAFVLIIVCGWWKLKRDPTTPFFGVVILAKVQH